MGYLPTLMKKIFEAILPGWTGNSDLPKEFPLYIRIVLKLSVLMIHVFSILNFGLPFGMISQEKREALITKLYHHPSAVVRNLIQWWKLLALTTQC